MTYRPYHEGFTCLELMCCICILAILTCISLSTFQHLLTKVRVQRITQEIIYAVRYARNQALIQDTITVLSPINGSNWSDGIQLQLEHEQHIFNKNAILYMWKWDLPSIKVTWVGFEHQQKIKFSNALNHASSNGHFLIESGSLSQKITLNRLGRILEQKVNRFKEGEA